MTDNVELFQWPEDLSQDASGGDFILPDEDLYDYIKITDITDVQLVAPEYNKTGKKLRAKFQWRIFNHPDYPDGQVGGTDWINLTMHETGKLYPIAKAVNGGKIESSHKINKEELMSRYFRCQVEHGKPNEKKQVYAHLKPETALVQKNQSYVPTNADTESTAEVPF